MIFFLFYDCYLLCVSKNIIKTIKYLKALPHGGCNLIPERFLFLNQLWIPGSEVQSISNELSKL